MERLKRLSIFGLTDRKLFEDTEYTRAGLRNLIDQHVVFVAEREEYGEDHKSTRTIGFIGGYFIHHPFNPTVKMLSELFWWVDEEYRGCGAGGKLLRQFIHVGQAAAHWIVFGLSTNTPVKESSLLKLGFKKSETSYLMEIK